MTRSGLLYFRGLMMAGAAAAAKARQARTAGDVAAFRDWSRRASGHYLQARIERGDPGALVENAEGVLAEIERIEQRQHLLEAQLRTAIRHEVEDAYLRAALTEDAERRLSGALPRGHRPAWANAIKRERPVH